jgi:hypothetical protein
VNLQALEEFLTVKQTGQVQQGFCALSAVAIEVTVTVILTGSMEATASLGLVHFPLLICYKHSCFWVDCVS